jgi:CheY-like chemotaxis protein
MSCKVLLLDEDTTSAGELEIGLRELGCEVLLTAEADMFGLSRALTRVAKDPVDLIFLAVDSGSKGALDLCERLKRDPRTSALPVIVVAVDVDVLIANESARSRPDGYLRRPIARGDLVAQVQKCVPWLTPAVAHSQTRLASVPPTAGDEDEALVVDWEEAASSGGGAKSNDALRDVQEALAREQASHEANIRRARQALEGARRAKHAAARKADARTRRSAESRRELEAAQRQAALAAEQHRAALEALAADHAKALAETRSAEETAVGLAARTASEEAQARAAARDEEHARAVEQLTRKLAEETAALAAERVARAEMETAYATSAAAHTAASAGRDAEDRSLEELRAAHAAELARLDQSLDDVVEQERLAGTQRVAEANAAAMQAVVLSISQTRRAAQKELAAAVEANDRAHERKLEEERARAASKLAATIAEHDAHRHDLERQVAEERAHDASIGAAAASEREAQRNEQDRLLADDRARAASTAATVAAEHEARKKELEVQLEQDHARAASIATTTAALRVELERQLAEATARAGTLDRDLTSATGAHDVLTKNHEHLARELEAARVEHDAALRSARVEAEEKLGREVARATALEEGVRAGDAAQAELVVTRDGLLEDIETLRNDHELALERAAVASVLHVRRTEAMLAEERANGAKAARVAGEQLAALRAELAAAGEREAALRVAQAAELARVDESLGRVLEQERAAATAGLEEVRAAGALALEEARTASRLALDEARAAAATSLDETRAAAVQAVALGVAEAQRVGKSALEEAVAAHDHARDAAMAAEHARAAAELDVEKARATTELGAQRAQAANELEASRAAAATGLGAERERAAAELEALRTQHEETLSQAESDAETRIAATEEKLRDLNARHLEVVGERHEKSARVQALEEELGAATARHVELSAAHDREAAHAHALGEELRASNLAAENERRQREELAATLESQRSAHVVSTERAATDAREQGEAVERRLNEALEAANRKVGDVDARYADLAAAHERETARARTLEQSLDASNIAREDGRRQREELAGMLEAQRREHATAADRAAGKAREQREALERQCDDAVQAGNRKLGEADARYVALTAALEKEAVRARTLEESLLASRTTGDGLANEREELTRGMAALRAEHASTLAAAEANARARACALEEKLAELDARHLEVAADRQEKVARVQALEEQIGASNVAREDGRRQLEGVTATLEEERKERAHSTARASGEARDQREAAEHALDEARRASERTLADASARYADLMAAHERETTRARALEESLLASKATGDGLAGEREDLTRALAVLRAEHTSAREAAEAESQNRLRVAEEKLAELDARHFAVVAERAARVQALEDELGAANVAREAGRRSLEELTDTLERQRREHASERDDVTRMLEGMRADHVSAFETAEAQAKDRLRATEEKLAELNARHLEVVAERHEKSARGSALEAELEATGRALVDAEARAASTLTTTTADLEAKRRRELAEERDRQGARRREIEGEHAAAEKAREAAHAEALAKRDLASAEDARRRDAEHAEDIARREALHAQALTERDVVRSEDGARREAAHADALAQRDAALAEALTQGDAVHADALASLEAAHVAAVEVRDSAYADSLASRDAAHNEALAIRDAGHAETVARLEAGHAARLSDLERALTEQTAVAQAVDTKQSTALAAHDEVVKRLRKEIDAALGALSAERQKRAMDAAQAKALAEKKRTSGELRAVKIQTEPKRHPTPPNVPKVSGERTVTHADPRGVLRTILARALGAAGRAELVLAAVLGAAKTKELPVHGDQLLALLERHLHAELRGQVGEAAAHTIMDELSSALVERVSAESVRGENIEHHSTTRPPPAMEEGPVTKDLVRPEIPPAPRPVRVPGRAVLVIDRDRMARANVSRALAREGCEITVRDSCAGIDEGAGEFDVIVTEIVDVGIEELIKTFGRGRAPCPVIAWTASVDAAQVMFHSAGIPEASVVMKEARADALVAAIRKNLGETTGVARG